MNWLHLMLIAMIVLKLCAVIQWSWWLVIWPAYCLFLIGFLIGAISDLQVKLKRISRRR